MAGQLITVKWPQFVDPARGSVTVPMMVYLVWLAVPTALGFVLMGISATVVSRHRYRPQLVNWLHVSAGR